MPFAHEPADHAEIDRPVAASLPDGAVATPMAPQECIDVPGAEAVDSLGHLALKRKPPHFAVGHDVEPRCLLEGNGLIDGAIFYGLELRVTKTPGHPVVPRSAQRDRPEKTANNIGMGRNHRRLRRSDRIKRIDAILTLALPLFGGGGRCDRWAHLRNRWPGRRQQKSIIWTAMRLAPLRIAAFCAAQQR